MNNPAWKELKFGDVATLQRGFDLPASQRRAGSVSIISSSGVCGFHDEYMIAAPGVVTGRYGTIGNIFYVEENFWPLNTSLFVSDFKDNHPRFIYYLLQTIDLKKFSDKTGVPGINRNDVHKIKVLRPPIEEQKKIAEILGTWDEAIGTIENLIESKQKVKVFLLDFFFGDKNHSKKAMKIFALEEIASVERGKFTVRPRNDPRYYGGDIPFVQTGDIAAANGNLKTYSQTLNEAGVGVSKVFPKGSILITIAANIGEVAITEIDVACPDSIIVIQAHPNICSCWLKYALTVKKQELESLATQNAQKNINLQVLRPLAISTPKKIEQEKIAMILASHDKEIGHLLELLTCYKKQKQGLMQQLLTGKLRVNTGRTK
jgi:type I restriction enzyme, S subunit